MTDQRTAAWIGRRPIVECLEPRTHPDAAPAAVESFTNPVLNRDFPDPGAVYANGFYYAFATNGNRQNVQAARSNDLAHWTALPDALPNLPSWVMAGRTWAPDVTVTSSGQYVMYYTAWTRSNGRQAIGVATSTNPAGPFMPIGTAPLVTQYDQGGAIDPSVFTAENGVQYLLWKNDGNAVGQDTNIYLQELSTDGLSLVGAAAALIKQDKAWEGSVVEGPVLWTHGGKFYLFYCANNFASSAYATGYAESDFLRGPYTKPGGPLVTSQGYVVGPGGPEIVVGPDGNDWMLYHAWEGGFSYRSLSIDRLDWFGGAPVLRGPSRTQQPVPMRPQVVARHVFYNGSAFDGADAAADPRDDAAVATDKLPLLPAQTAAFANVTTYARGINGLMIDLTRLPETAPAVTAASFSAQMIDRGAWTAAPVPSSVTVRRGAGVNGSDRITVTWPDGAIRNTWLRLTLQATPSTALAAADLFTFGNLVGDTGDNDTTFRINALDLAAVRRALNTDSVVTGRYDFNRDGQVNALDLAAVRGNYFAALPPVGEAVPLAAMAPLPPRDVRSDGGDALLA